MGNFYEQNLPPFRQGPYIRPPEFKISIYLYLYLNICVITLPFQQWLSSIKKTLISNNLDTEIV